MPTEDTQASPVYFDTPERAERLQLIIHLLNNAEDVAYLRAAPEAGKTRFAAHLAEQMADDYSIVWMNAEGLDSVPQAVSSEMGLDLSLDGWPSSVFEAAGDKPLLLLVDDADALDLASIGQLFELHESGARLLLLGNGGLSQLQGQWDLQFVDLPPFSEPQSVAFIREVGGIQDETLSDQAARSLHHAAAGLPGHLVKALHSLPTGKKKAAPSDARAAVSPMMIGIGALLALLLILALVFQDSINALFEPEPVSFATELDPAVTTAAPPPSRLADGVAPIERSEPAPVPEALPAPVQIDLPVAGSLAPAEVQQPSPATDADEDAQPAAEVSEPAASASADNPTTDPADDSADAVLDAVIAAAITAAEQPAGQAAPAGGVQPEPAPAPEPAAVPTSGSAAQPAPESPAQATAKPAPGLPVPDVQDAASESVAAGESAKPAPVASPAPAVPATAAPARPASETGLAWLKAESPQRYTLQLVGARESAAIDKFIAKHGIKPPYAVFARDLSGKPWYSLVAGSYADRDAAVAARAAMPAELSQGGVWPRTFASVHEQITP